MQLIDRMKKGSGTKAAPLPLPDFDCQIIFLDKPSRNAGIDMSLLRKYDCPRLSVLLIDAMVSAATDINIPV